MSYRSSSLHASSTLFAMRTPAAFNGTITGKGE